MRIPQPSNIASCSGFHNCKWTPQNVSGIRKLSGIRKTWKRNQQTVKELRNLFITELAFALEEFKSKDLTIAGGFYEQILKHWLSKSMDVTLQCLQAVFRIIVLELQHPINSLGEFGIWVNSLLG